MDAVGLCGLNGVPLVARLGLPQVRRATSIMSRLERTRTAARRRDSGITTTTSVPRTSYHNPILATHDSYINPPNRCSCGVSPDEPVCVYAVRVSSGGRRNWVTGSIAMRQPPQSYTETPTPGTLPHSYVKPYFMCAAVLGGGGCNGYASVDV